MLNDAAVALKKMYFCTAMRRLVKNNRFQALPLLVVGLLMACSTLSAQNGNADLPKPSYLEVRGIPPANKPPKTTYAEVIGGDTVPVAMLGNVYSFPNETFRNTADEKYYWKLVRDVKIVYPLSRIVYLTLLETMKYLETIPDQKEKDKHLRKMERDLVKEYEPVLRKMSYNQGKILLKLINRECNTSSYELIKAYRGSFTASLWQGVAKLFHADLKAGYDPKTAEDHTIERIVIKIEQGQL
jgi:hypothetical protein